jgi:hypothetical protein
MWKVENELNKAETTQPATQSLAVGSRMIHKEKF